MVQHSRPYMIIGKTIALTIRTFVGKIISLLFNTMSRFVIVFLPRSKYLLISWLESPSAVILESKKIKSVTASISLDCFHGLQLNPGLILPWIQTEGSVLVPQLLPSCVSDVLSISPLPLGQPACIPCL